MKKILSLILCCALVLSFCACEKMDPNYGKSSQKVETKQDEAQPQTVSLPEIKSDDEVMPTYFDLSLYDEENYADIYLGKDFEYKITYGGSNITVPTSYKNMIKDGWHLAESDAYNEDSQILVGKSLTVDFVNDYNDVITAVFYNESKASLTLKKCPIVKFIVAENCSLVSNSDYGVFWLNGISNDSAITDVVELLGSPSHFYRVSEDKYYLDFFITEIDRRSGITVYVDTANDQIDSIEFSYY